jgi:hypothetical protein
MALLLPQSVAVLIRSWLDFDTGAQTTRLCALFHSELVDVTLKVCQLISEHHAHVKICAKEEIASKLVCVLRGIMESVLNAKVSSNRRTAQYRKFFEVSPGTLQSREKFKDHCALILGDNIYSAFTREVPRLAVSESCSGSHLEENLGKASASKDWPIKISPDFAKKCAARYREAYQWKSLLCCAVCARSSRHLSMTVYELKNRSVHLPKGFDVLRMNEGHNRYNQPDFHFGHPALDHLMVSRYGVKNPDEESNVELNVCNECLNPLKRNTVPRHALMNGLYVGELPDHLKDISWLEEQICALARTGPIEFRLYGSDSKEQPFLARGNVCVHPQPTVSTANILPLLPQDINEMIAVIFTSSLNKMPENIARHVFRVRKRVIHDFLVHMHATNPLYKDVTIQEEYLNMYPEDGALPGIHERVVVNQVPNASEIFEEETAAFEPHPASDSNKSVSEPTSESSDKVHIEHMGIYDSDGKSESCRFLKASALRELAPSERPSHLVVPRSPEALSEYANPTLFPKMFPSLFPLGIGGFDDTSRKVPIGFRNQIEHFLDLHSPLFRRHQSFMFVALNIYQRRLSHLHTSLAMRKPRYAHVAPKIASLTPEILNRVAKFIEQEKKVSDLPTEDKDVFALVNEASVIGANIPGSSASKQKSRNDIRAYFGYFGMPQLFLTMNPNASHSPLFQVIYGDELVDITKRFPDLTNSVNRRIRVASDAVAGETFFSRSIEIFFEHLLGWDHETKRSKAQGGIFGKLRAYYGTVEFTDRGQLHGHFLIWLDGGINPRETHTKLKENPDWQKQYFDFLEDIIHHHAPDVDIALDPDFEPRVQCPPDPKDPLFDVEFPCEVKRCAEVLQKHDVPCRKVCFKYGSEDCRFGFPHDIIPESSFDKVDNSISLKCLDPMMNWFNPYILTFCRHNHDLKWILSGKSAKAAMLYITDYITKDDEQIHHTLSTFSAAVAKVADRAMDDPKDRTRAYLHSCLAAQIRYRKIHAQQCVRYCRGKSDVMCSHATVPLLSVALLSYMRQRYPTPHISTAPSKPSGTDDDDSDSQSDNETGNIEQVDFHSKNMDSDDEHPLTVGIFEFGRGRHQYSRRRYISAPNQHRRGWKSLSIQPSR